MFAVCAWTQIAVTFHNVMKFLNYMKLLHLKYGLIYKLSTSKASGLDNIPVRLLKLINFTTVVSLTHIINLVIRKGIIPADWKCARVSAIYKHDSKLDLNNYRPISVLPVV